MGGVPRGWRPGTVSPYHNASTTTTTVAFVLAVWRRNGVSPAVVLPPRAGFGLGPLPLPAQGGHAPRHLDGLAAAAGIEPLFNEGQAPVEGEASHPNVGGEGEDRGQKGPAR